MLKKFNWNPEMIPKILKLNNNSAESSVSPELIKAQKNILMKAALAFLTIVLTIVILFAMTSAWYTNIVQTSGLVFEVESWGFDGEIEVDDGPILAGPGDSGIIGLSMDGTEGEILEVSVGVSKEAMVLQNAEDSDAMKKRFFFYVDKPGTKNGEQVDRFYINSIEDYTYTVFSGGSVKISEDFSNVPELKWQWVYDVLGYYVKGTVVEIDGVTTMDITEYLRPIEYDFDKATFIDRTITVGEGDDAAEIGSKMIDTVDGTRTPEQFLAEFSANDGYEGTISADSTVVAGGKTYYEVAEGIYAYLCDYQEIEKATDFDTELGRQAQNESLKYMANVNISVQNRKEAEEVVAVSDETALREALAGEGSVYIKLESDIAAEKYLEIPVNKKVEIDLNGHKITAPAKNYGFLVSDGSDFTLLNGEVVPAEGGSVSAFYMRGANLTLSGVSVTEGFDYGIFVVDYSATQSKADSAVRICGSDIKAGTGVVVYGNGDLSEQKTKIIIESSEIETEGYALSGNGSNWGTDIQIIGSKLVSTGSAAIYHPQMDSTLTICGCEIRGFTGIAIKAGFVKIIDSEITGTTFFEDPGFNNSGFSDTGDAVYIETNYGHPISLVIKGKTTLTATDENSFALRVYEETAPNVTVEIFEGTFSHVINQKWVAEGSSLGDDGKTVSISASGQEETE